MIIHPRRCAPRNTSCATFKSPYRFDLLVDFSVYLSGWQHFLNGGSLGHNQNPGNEAFIPFDAPYIPANPFWSLMKMSSVGQVTTNNIGSLAIPTGGVDVLLRSSDSTSAPTFFAPFGGVDFWGAAAHVPDIVLFHVNDTGGGFGDFPALTLRWNQTLIMDFSLYKPAPTAPFAEREAPIALVSQILIQPAVIPNPLPSWISGGSATLNITIDSTNP